MAVSGSGASVGASRARVLAELVEAVESQTPYGGRAVTWQGLGTVWLERGEVRRREVRTDGLAHPVDQMTVRVREDGRLMVGRVLRLSGDDWRIEAVGPDRVGRLELDLERMA